MVDPYVPVPVAAPELVLKRSTAKEAPDPALVTEYTTSAFVRPGARVRARVIHRARMGYFRLVHGKLLPTFLM